MTGTAQTIDQTTTGQTSQHAPEKTAQTATRPAAANRVVTAGRFSTAVNKAVRWMTAHGVSLAGSRILAVRGRKSGEWRTTPVNPLAHGDDLYLVAPRGHTQWVRNLRATDGGELRLGKRVQTFSYVELADHEKPDVLRAYILKWKWEVGVFFDGVDAGASDEELLRIAPGYPVFRIRTQG